MGVRRVLGALSLPTIMLVAGLIQIALVEGLSGKFVGWLKELWQDITEPNPLSPGPFTRFLGRFWGVKVE